MQAIAASPTLPERVKAQVQRIDPAAEVILFGSRARGDFRADSDWDFLVLCELPLNERLEQSLRNQLYEIELQSGQVITAVIEEKGKWQDFKITTFYKNIEKEGIPID